jgi:hypothetical protein
MLRVWQESRTSIAWAGTERPDPSPVYATDVPVFVFATDLRMTPLRFSPPEGIESQPVGADQDIPRPLQLFQGEPLVRLVAQTALDSHFGQIWVVVDKTKAASAAIARALGNLPVALVPLDKVLQQRADADGSCFSFLHLSKGRLAFCQQMLHESGLQAVAVLAADQVLVRPYHSDRLCAAWHDGEAA